MIQRTWKQNTSEILRVTFFVKSVSRGNLVCLCNIRDVVSCVMFADIVLQVLADTVMMMVEIVLSQVIF